MAKKVQVNGSNVEGTSGAAAPSKIVQIGGSDGTNLQPQKMFTSGVAAVSLTTTAGAALNVNTPSADGLNLSAAMQTVLPANVVFNGTTWDRVRNNLQGTLLASAARTETASSPDQTNYNGRGVHVILDVTASADTPSIVLKIEGKDAAGNYYTLLEGAAVTGDSTNVYKVMPWIAAVANVSAADLVPRTWRVTVTHADADSITYGVYYALDN
jgi:hypothetical protein